MNDKLIERLRKTAKCVYLATEAAVADDIADALNKAADALEATPPAPASLAREKQGMPEWAMHAASEVLWGPSGPMVPNDELSMDEQIEMEKTAAIIAKHFSSAALTPGDAGGEGQGECVCGEPGVRGVCHRKDGPCYHEETGNAVSPVYEQLNARIAELETEVADAKVKNEGMLYACRKHSDTALEAMRERDDLRAQLAAALEVAELKSTQLDRETKLSYELAVKAQLAAPPAALPPARPATDGKDDWAEPLLHIKANYNELIYAVARKFDGETRHETALRYINEAETVRLTSPEVTSPVSPSNKD